MFEKSTNMSRSSMNGILSHTMFRGVEEEQADRHHAPSPTSTPARAVRPVQEASRPHRRPGAAPSAVTLQVGEGHVVTDRFGVDVESYEREEVATVAAELAEHD
jgi:hypothetical protein